MRLDHKIPKFKENLILKDLVRDSGLKINYLAKRLELKDPITGEEKIGCSSVILSQTINGHHKGVDIKAALLKELGISDDPTIAIEENNLTPSNK